MSDAMTIPTKRRSFDDDVAEVRLAKIRAKIQRNLPKERSPLHWRKVADRLMRSHCNRFQVEKRGDGEAVRYYAFILPDRVIGHRLLTADQAKEVCERHASPLPLDAPATTPVVDREPGSDDK